MVPGKELPALQLTPVPTTVLAGIVVPGEEKSIGDLTAESPGDLDEPNKAYDEGKWEFRVLGTKGPGMVGLQELSLPVEHEANRPPYRDHRQGFVGSV